MPIAVAVHVVGSAKFRNTECHFSGFVFQKVGRESNWAEHVLAAWARIHSISCTKNDNVNMFARLNESSRLLSGKIVFLLSFGELIL